MLKTFIFVCKICSSTFIYVLACGLNIKLRCTYVSKAPYEVYVDLKFIALFNSCNSGLGIFQ
jgi:hypothetical protein